MEDQEVIKVRSGSHDDGQIKFEIRNIPDFKIILESVKFPKESKNRFNVSTYLSSGLTFNLGCCFDCLEDRCYFKICR